MGQSKDSGLQLVRVGLRRVSIMVIEESEELKCGTEIVFFTLSEEELLFLPNNCIFIRVIAGIWS